MSKTRGLKPENLTVAIQGAGNAGLTALQILSKQGYKGGRYLRFHGGHL